MYTRCISVIVTSRESPVLSLRRELLEAGDCFDGQMVMVGAFSSDMFQRTWGYTASMCISTYLCI